MSGIARLLFVQFGDFAKAHAALAAGQPETYRDQQRSVDLVAALAPTRAVTVACFRASAPEVALAPGLCALGLETGIDRAGVRALFERARPEALVLRTPHRLILEEANRRGLPVLPSFADLFTRGGFGHGLRRGLQNWRMARALAAPGIACVSNHSLNASRSMAEALGIDPARIVPWDWSRLTPSAESRTAPRDASAPRGFYAGLLQETKGVGDCLRAVALLRGQGRALRFDFAGPGDPAPWQAEAERLGIADLVRFLGVIPNRQVRTEMQGADIVVVPSRHAYPEGLPNTIYEGLASRTPLIISDHPAFAGRIDPAACLVFPQTDAAALAAAIARLCDDPALYAGLSQASAAALERLYIGVEWGDLLHLWLADPANRTGWVAPRSLAACAPPAP